MIKKSFLLGVITSVIAINSVFADATITTKNYVDTTRQATIPAAGTNEDTPGETVVTYTDTAGVIGERGIYDGGILWKKDDRLTTVYGVEEMIDSISPTGTAGTVPVYDNDGELGNVSRGIYDGSTTYDSSTDADKLVTASALQDSIPSQFVTVTEKSCEEYIENTEHTDSNCLLWRFTNVDVLADCSDSKCDSK